MKTTKVSTRFLRRASPADIEDGTADEDPRPATSDTHFSGSWTSRARGRVQDAVFSAERLLTHRSGLPVPPFGARWVCVAHSARDRSVYLAHRIGADRVLRADSVEKLVQRICSFAFGA
ncbi:hypothetical protein [Longibacter sp.]|uniref:hypothetical protein n=1 Tax=Longibacter sp. TaxID=2045415 RepID=UPI003EBAED46